MAWLVDRIVGAILNWLLGRGIRLGRQIEIEREIDKQAKEQADALKNATTPEGFDDAAKDIFRS